MKGGWVCPICGQKLKPRGTKDSHMKSRHPGPTDFSVGKLCEQCGDLIDFYGESMRMARKKCQDAGPLCERCQKPG